VALAARLGRPPLRPRPVRVTAAAPEVAAPLLAPGHDLPGHGDRTVSAVALCPGCRCRRECVTVEFTDGTAASFPRRAMVAVAQPPRPAPP
jgi:hypothetical protein